MVRTKKIYDTYYWILSAIVFFVFAIINSIMIFRFIVGGRSNILIGLAVEAPFLFLSLFLLKTAAGLLREYQFEPFGITEYSIFRRKRAIAWNDYPYAYIIRTGPMFRLPHSCMHYFLFAKSRLPSRITKEKDKDPAYYLKNPKEYMIFGYSEDLEQKIREMRPEITFIKRDLYR